MKVNEETINAELRARNGKCLEAKELLALFGYSPTTHILLTKVWKHPWVKLVRGGRGVRKVFRIEVKEDNSK